METPRENKQIDLPSLVEWGDGKWREQAACSGSATRDFFPVRGEGDTAAMMSRARLICAKCKVRKECLSFALVNRSHYGMWGGLAPDDRVGLTLEDVDKATQLSPIALMAAFRRLKIHNPLDHLAEIMGVDVDEASKALTREQNNRI